MLSAGRSGLVPLSQRFRVGNPGISSFRTDPRSVHIFNEIKLLVVLFWSFSSYRVLAQLYVTLTFDILT